MGLTAVNNITLRDVYALEGTYDAGFLAPAANYRKLGLCASGVKATLAAPCADRSTVVKLQAVDRNAQSAISALKTFVTNHPGQVDISGLYDAAKAAVSQAVAIAATLNTLEG